MTAPGTGRGIILLAIGAYMLWLGVSTVIKIIPKLVGRSGTYSADAAASSPNKKLARYGIITWGVLIGIFVVVSLGTIGYGIYDHFAHATR